MDPFALLGLPPDATPSEVRSAFWARARAMHPDRHPDDPRANERFRRVVLAYEDALRTARGLPRRSQRRPAAAPVAARPPVWRCPTCGDGYDYEDSCPRCETVAAVAPAPPAAHVLSAASLLIGSAVVTAGIRPVALGGMLILFGLFGLGMLLHERLRPALSLARP